MGGITSPNYGPGLLSARQKPPDTNAYGYYYWCSPVGNAVSTYEWLVNNENIELLQFMKKRI